MIIYIMLNCDDLSIAEKENGTKGQIRVLIYNLEVEKSDHPFISEGTES